MQKFINYQGLGGGRTRELFVNGYRVSVCGNEKVVVMNGGDDSQPCEYT
jgi:hypothetical protein